MPIFDGGTELTFPISGPDISGSALEDFAECFGFFPTFPAPDSPDPIWLTSYPKPVNISFASQYRSGMYDGTYSAIPSAIDRSSFTRTMDPRETSVDITLQGLYGSQQFLMKAATNNWIVIILWQSISIPSRNKILFTGDGIPTLFGGDSATLMVRQDERVLDRQIPDIVYQKLCNNILFDARCKLNRTSWQAIFPFGEFTEVAGIGYLHPLLVPFSSNHFRLGQFVIGDWENSKERKMIVQSYDGKMYLDSAFSRSIEVNETVIVSPGCDKLSTTCASKFNNSTNFFGFTLLPLKNPTTQGMF